MKKHRARALRQHTQLRHIVRTAANVKESKAAKINRLIAPHAPFQQAVLRTKAQRRRSPPADRAGVASATSRCFLSMSSSATSWCTRFEPFATCCFECKAPPQVSDEMHRRIAFGVICRE